MSVVVITPPEPIVSWEEARRHLRVEDDEEKDYVEALIAAATGWIDGPAGWLGRCLGPQLLQIDGELPCRRLPYGPVLEIESITTDSFSDAPVTVDPSEYRLNADGSVTILYGSGWSQKPEQLIRYWAGYGKRADDGEGWTSEVPAAIKQAILLLVGHWYANREEVVTGTITSQVPMAAEALLSTYRVYR